MSLCEEIIEGKFKRRVSCCILILKVIVLVRGVFFCLLHKKSYNPSHPRQEFTH